MIIKATKIISSEAGIDDTWNAVSRFIPDIDARQELDAEFKTFEDDEDKEDWFENEIFDYMNDVVVGDSDFTFGVRKQSGDLGFWNEKEIDYGDGDKEDTLDEAIRDYEKYEEELDREENPEGEEMPKHVAAEIVTDDEIPEHLKDKET